MEMDPICLDDKMEGIEDESSEQLLSPCSSDVGETFGDPQVLPRIGDQYQAEISPLVAECNQLQLINKQADSELMVNLRNPFLLGFPIPLMWTRSEVENINGTLEAENSEESQITSSNEYAEPKVKHLDTVLEDQKDIDGHSKIEPTAGSELMDLNLVLPHESNSKLELGRCLCPVPGSLGESWKDVERDIFLLGLYIFGKNLILVKRFVESKEMGDILSFYYGKFYRSDEYRKWSECRKLRSKRCIYGQKIFTGWRQQELLSRIFSHVSEECKTMLLELSRTFGEGKVSFEEYVFTLKSTVGINMLIEVVGIGKGKQNLTGIAMEPAKTNHVFSVQPEIPIGKACSSLTSAEIIKFLTGGFRLSKARSSDLFWEAVWPQLLARGWHSEQPYYKDHVMSGSKNSLVFLMPGVKKFSRRRLVKGNHYFDSVSDVLNKVASDPALLELETEAAKGSGNKEENRWDPSMKEDPHDLSNKKQRCYLQPHNSNRNRDLPKFTIVDTSVVEGTERPKVRELRSLPFEAATVSTTPSSLSSESEQDTSEDSEDKAEEANTSNATGVMTERGACGDSSDCVNSILNIGTTNTSNPTSVAVEDHESHSNKKQQMKTMKYQSSRKVKPGSLKYLAPVTKLPDLTTCIHGESSCSIENISTASKGNEDESHCRSKSPNACDETDFQIGSSQNLSPASSLAKGSSDRSNEGFINENFLDREVSPEKPQPHSFIDLNIPQVSPDSEIDEPVITNMVQNNENCCANKSSFQSEASLQSEPLNPPDGDASMDQHSIVNDLRKSTRNRPLTTKALEAFAYGFLSPKKKRKSSEASQNNSMPRSSQKVRGQTVVTAAFRNGNDSTTANSKESSLNGICSETNMVGESKI